MKTSMRVSAKSSTKLFVPVCFLAAFGLFVGQNEATATPIPDLDFRDSSVFTSAYQDESSATFSFTNLNGDLITGSVTATGGELWWDSVDGLGVRGMEDDEIDVGETLRIDFDTTIGVSHLFFSDLFANEGTGWDEAGSFSLSSGSSESFDALSLSAWGNAANGEAMYDFGQVISVDWISFTATGGQGQSDFSVIGLLDPHEPGHTVPEPGTLALFGFGLAAAGLWGRRARR